MTAVDDAKRRYDEAWAAYEQEKSLETAVAFDYARRELRHERLRAWLEGHDPANRGLSST